VRISSTRKTYLTISGGGAAYTSAWRRSPGRCPAGFDRCSDSRARPPGCSSRSRPKRSSARENAPGYLHASSDAKSRAATRGGAGGDWLWVSGCTSMNPAGEPQAVGGLGRAVRRGRTRRFAGRSSSRRHAGRRRSPGHLHGGRRRRESAHGAGPVLVRRQLPVVARAAASPVSRARASRRGQRMLAVRGAPRRDRVDRARRRRPATPS